MKKILYILLIALLASCDSLLDVEPETEVTFDNFYKTEQDLEVTLYQMQSFVWRVGGAGSHAGMGDIREVTSSLRQAWDPIKVVGSNGTGSADWTERYWVIYMANVLLDNMHNAQGNVTPERLDFYRAQAYFAKALSYFYLSRTYGEVPITRNSSSSEPYGKKPVLEVLDTVIANATRAFNILPVQGAVVDRLGAVINSKQFESKGNACALLAHAYAWKGSMIDLLELEGDSKDCYNKSIEYTGYLIKGDVGNYTLVRDPEKLSQLFSDNEANNPESIFEYTLDMQDEYIFSTYLFGQKYIGYPQHLDYSASEHKYKKEEALIAYSTIKSMYDESDLRPQAYFYRYAYYSTDTVELMFMEDEYTEEQRQYNRDSVRDEINKITGGYAFPYRWRVGIYEKDAYNPNLLKLVAMKSNYAYWRLADIYLLRAECYVKVGEESLAKKDLNEIRSYNRAKAYPNSSGDEKGLKYAIFHERERELLMEGHRFYDVVRNGMEYINTYLEPTAFKTMTIADVKSGAIFYPIHDSAFKNNSLLRQNTYWAQYIN